VPKGAIGTDSACPTRFHTRRDAHLHSPHPFKQQPALQPCSSPQCPLQAQTSRQAPTLAQKQKQATLPIMRSTFRSMGLATSPAVRRWNGYPTSFRCTPRQRFLAGHSPRPGLMNSWQLPQNTATTTFTPPSPFKLLPLPLQRVAEDRALPHR
jgi:hypothetical protein